MTPEKNRQARSASAQQGVSTLHHSSLGRLGQLLDDRREHHPVRVGCMYRFTEREKR